MSTLVTKEAPDFKAKAVMPNNEFNNEFKLSAHRGKYVVLFFYPLDFTFVCPSEIVAFDKKVEEFKKRNCEVIGVSVDSHFTHKAWFERDLKEVKFPVLADTNHAISRDYGVLIEDRGIALRGTFLIDPHGVLQWMTVNALGTGRNVDEVLRTLQALKTGELCPAEWKPGQATLK